MSSLSEILNAIHDIRTLLRQSLTPNFFNSVKSACDAISRLLHDPSLVSEIKKLLSDLHRLLQKIEEEDFIEKTTALITEIQNKLSQIGVKRLVHFSDRIIRKTTQLMHSILYKGNIICTSLK